jgi:hypothetical protein
MIPPSLQSLEIFELRYGILSTFSVRFFIICKISIKADIF